MSAEIDQMAATAADAAAGALSRKRKEPDDDLLDDDSKDDGDGPSMTGDSLGGPMTKAREVRLEQNRKAARESRRRKKVMIEELQRSVIFFSRANGALKQQNDELTRLLMQAQAQISVHGQGEEGNNEAAALSTEDAALQESTMQQQAQEQAQAQAVATQASYSTRGFSRQAARQAAQTMNGNVSENLSVPTAPSTSLPPMQPGATMQAMANFQQAAAAAMQAAMQGMQSIPGVNMSQLAAAPAGANAQQAYTDTMTALAMQQAAAAAAAGQQFIMQPGSIQFMPHPMMAWQQPIQPQQPPQQQQQQQHQVEGGMKQ